MLIRKKHINLSLQGWLLIAVISITVLGNIPFSYLDTDLTEIELEEKGENKSESKSLKFELDDFTYEFILESIPSLNKIEALLLKSFIYKNYIASDILTPPPERG